MTLEHEGSARAPNRILRSRPLHEAAVDRLRDMVLDGDFAIGERLHDANLADLLGVSRTPIREALKLLAREGLVDLQPGRGARVAAYSLGDLIALIEVIAGLERHACELAVERMSVRDFDALRFMHDEMAACHSADQRHDYSRLNQQIHLGLVALAGNAALTATHAGLITRARRGRHDALESKERWVEAMAEHDQFMTALAQRNGRLAGEIMLCHNLHTRDVLQLRYAAETIGDSLTDVQSRQPCGSGLKLCPISADVCAGLVLPDS